jgi:hypothetical protein
MIGIGTYPNYEQANGLPWGEPLDDHPYPKFPSEILSITLDTLIRLPTPSDCING